MTERRTRHDDGRVTKLPGAAVIAVRGFLRDAVVLT